MHLRKFIQLVILRRKRNIKNKEFRNIFAWTWKDWEIRKWKNQSIRRFYLFIFKDVLLLYWYVSEADQYHILIWYRYTEIFHILVHHTWIRISFVGSKFSFIPLQDGQFQRVMSPFSGMSSLAPAFHQEDNE